jgi:hypothetical protein
MLLTDPAVLGRAVGAPRADGPARTHIEGAAFAQSFQIDAATWMRIRDIDNKM